MRCTRCDEPIEEKLSSFHDDVNELINENCRMTPDEIRVAVEFEITGEIYDWLLHVMETDGGQPFEAHPSTGEGMEAYSFVASAEKFYIYNNKDLFVRLWIEPA